jgi:aerobic carbon-monoxide dehydrogenase medium subunit
VVGVLVADFGGDIRVGITGAGPCAFRGTALEQALKVDLSPAAIDGVDVPDAGFNSDLFASAEYRAHLVKVMARRAVQALLGD